MVECGLCEARTGAAALQAQVNARLKLVNADQRSAKCKAAGALWMRPARARRDIISSSLWTCCCRAETKKQLVRRITAWRRIGQL